MVLVTRFILYELLCSLEKFELYLKRFQIFCRCQAFFAAIEFNLINFCLLQTLSLIAKKARVLIILICLLNLTIENLKFTIVSLIRLIFINTNHLSIFKMSLELVFVGLADESEIVSLFLFLIDVDNVRTS